MRLECNKKVSEHTSIESLTELSGIPTLNQMIVESTLVETWKTINYKLPAYDSFKKQITLRSSRNTDVFQTPVLCNGHREWFVWKASKLWNTLPKYLQEETDFMTAKKQLKEFAKIYNLV